MPVDSQREFTFCKNIIFFQIHRQFPVVKGEREFIREDRSNAKDERGAVCVFGGGGKSFGTKIE